VDLLNWCVWCSDHKLKVDAETADGAGIASLICPRSGKVTDVGKQSGGTLWVPPSQWKTRNTEKNEHASAVLDSCGQCP